ncbi:MAG: translation elongation factor 4 [Minisyncoccia bacterium]
MINKIRNFAIIAHIDHGKSTLSDRFLELTNTIPKEKLVDQYLDRLSLERERGITIKMQPVRMKYKGYILNLIDTPGHCDFYYEVSRALSCVEGVILLVDGTQGIQAQTISHLKIAKELNLKIIPAINKIDLNIQNLDFLIDDIKKITNEEEVHLISAKYGIGVENLLDDIIKKIPPPKILNNNFKALIFDSHFDKYKGIIAHIRIFSGKLRKNEILYLKSSCYKFKNLEVGIFTPDLKEKEVLEEGEIGYIATGIKKPEIIKIGDTILKDLNEEPIPGYKEPNHVVFASIYPSEKVSYERFNSNIKKLRLNDPSVKLEECYSPILGRGYLIGFLGLLHLEIFQERLRREFETEVIITTPSVKYEILLKNGRIIYIQNPQELPDQTKIEEIREPIAKVFIYSPLIYIEKIINLVKNRRGIIKNQKFSSSFIELESEMPLDELITGFYDELKSISSGYASLNWEFLEYRKADLVKLDILVAEEELPSLSRIVHKDFAENLGRKIIKELKELLPREQFPIKLQAAIGKRIIARETIPALKADVAGWLYGGDITRKIKLWQKQKRGKKKLEKLGKGKVRIPNNVLIKILKIR